MSSLHTNAPARRLLCSARQRIQIDTLIATVRTGSYFGNGARGTRQYATHRLSPYARTANPQSARSTTPPSSPAPLRAPGMTAKDSRPPSRKPNGLIFSDQDIPPLQEWMTSLEGLGNKHLTPLQCVEGARRYVSIATQSESQWRPKLEHEHNLSPYMLHWIGILLVSGNTAARWRLGTHMLRSASKLGYVPSTLSLVRIFTSIPPHMFGRASNTIMYREAHAQFLEVVRAGTNPDALTLEGIIHAKNGGKERFLKALTAFRQATEAWQKTQREKSIAHGDTEADAPGKGIHAAAVTSDKRITSTDAMDAVASEHFSLPLPREPRWDWEVSCVLGQANILMKDRGTTEEALDLFRTAALELDNPLGFLMLAKLMGGPRDSPERRTYLLKAAISGETEACREMGELEALAAARHDLPQKERAEHEMLSKEWFRLADGKDVSAFIDANVGDQDGEE